MDDQKGDEGAASCWCHSYRSVSSRPSRCLCQTDFPFSDFEKTFIQCIVFNYETLHELKDEAAVKAAGKILTKGKDYVVEDGDILLIKAGAAKA